jgi:uncharacterized protein YhbP (UPF0306 family)
MKQLLATLFPSIFGNVDSVMAAHSKTITNLEGVAVRSEAKAAKAEAAVAAANARKAAAMAERTRAKNIAAKMKEVFA